MATRLEQCLRIEIRSDLRKSVRIKHVYAPCFGSTFSYLLEEKELCQRLVRAAFARNHEGAVG
jgi:hypothetical protein